MQTCTSSNLQTPSSNEIPESKHQKPSSKHQRNPKLQAPNPGPRFQLGTWSLELLWCLELGSWVFFGVWCLVFGAFHSPFLARFSFSRVQYSAARGRSRLPVRIFPHIS